MGKHHVQVCTNVACMLRGGYEILEQAKKRLEITYEVADAEELGAVWEDNELVTYDLPGFNDLFEYYANNEWLPDND